MSTSTASLKALNTSTAEFRAWGQAVHNAIAAVGLVQTADTGQIEWTTVNYSYSNSTDFGYEIWRFDDALQATQPIYLKISYGTSSNASYPGVGVSVGNVTNGAGVMGGVYTNLGRMTTNYGDSNGTCYFSSDKSYFCMTLVAMNSGTAYQWGNLVVDRTRNNDGSANADGLYIATGGANTASNAYGYYLNFLNSSVASTYVPVLNVYNQTTGSYGGDIMLFPHNVMMPKLEAPALACLSYWDGDIARGSQISVTHLGAAHTYLCLGSWAQGFDSKQTANMRLAMRYE